MRAVALRRTRVGDEFEHLGRVTGDERRPDAVNSSERIGPGWTGCRDRRERAVVGDRVRRLAGRRSKAPRLEGLEEAGIGVRQLRWRGRGAAAGTRAADLERLGGGQPAIRVAHVAAASLGLAGARIAEVVQEAPSPAV